MLNGDCFGFVLELFETGDSFAADGVGLAEEPLALVVVLCVVRLAGGTALGAPLPAMLLLNVPLDTTALGALAGKLSIGAFSTAILIGDESTLAVSFVC